jgi:hypothetical protein
MLDPPSPSDLDAPFLPDPDPPPDFEGSPDSFNFADPPSPA